MSKNPIFQERKKMSKNPIFKKKFFTAKFIVKKIRKIFTAKFIVKKIRKIFTAKFKKNLKKNLKNFSSKKWLKIFEKKNVKILNISGEKKKCQKTLFFRREKNM